jgi:archaeal flagellar protein FlaJ
METRDRFYISFAKFFPYSYQKNLKQLLIYAGDKTPVEIWLGSGNILGLLLFIAISLFPWAYFGNFKLHYFGIGIIAYIMVQFFIYLLIYFKVEDRAKRVEDALPDALQLMSSNLRAGMTPYKALKLSARKEFGPLAEEINEATSMALGTENFTTTLLRISDRVRSETLDRALQLFTSAMRSGGHLAQMLKELADDISQTKQLRDELITNTKTYTAFILFTIIVGTPLLLAISIYFVDVITGMQSKSISGDVGFGMDFLAGKIALTVDFLVKVSIAMLTITGLLASMLLGVIKEGQEKHGLKYAVPIIATCLIMFVVLRAVITNMFGGTF